MNNLNLKMIELTRRHEDTKGELDLQIEDVKKYVAKQLRNQKAAFDEAFQSINIQVNKDGT